jgi:hypothetical protein
MITDDGRIIIKSPTPIAIGANHQITKSSNHQITNPDSYRGKSPNHQITKSPNHQITKSPNYQITSPHSPAPIHHFHSPPVERYGPFG